MSQFPNQKLTYSQKLEKYGSLEDWGREVYQSVRNISSIKNRDTIKYSEDIEVFRNLYKGVLDLTDFEYVIRPYGDLTPEYPSQLRHYDRISSKINLLIGEELKRPFNHRAVSINPEAVTMYEEKLKEEIASNIQQRILSIMQKNGIINEQTPTEEIPEIPEVVEMFKSNFQTEGEKHANRALQYFKYYLNLEEELNKGFKDLVVDGSDIFYTGISNNEPVLRRVDAEYFDHDKTTHGSEYIEDAQWAYEERWLPVSQVYDEFFDDMDEDKITKLEEMKGTFKQNIGIGSGVPIIYSGNSNNFSTNGEYAYIGSNAVVKVINFVWKSLRKIGFVTYTDEETGEVLVKEVDESYKKQPEDIEIEWEWINEVWEFGMAGEDLVLYIRPRANQYRNLDNPSKCRLPYTGIYDPTFSIIRRVKEIQYMFNIIMYRLELSVAQAKGRKMIMDIAQIPKSEGFDMQKWLYYFDTAGLAFINSFEEGSGRFQGERPTFNQFSEIDLTLTSAINQYIGILDKLDGLMEDITGVSRQRQGNIHQSETVGGVERSVVQSSAITEFLFYKHNKVKKRVITNLIEESKLAWLSGKKAQYVMDDNVRNFIIIDGESYNSEEYGIVVTDSQIENRIIQFIEQNAMMSVQAGKAELQDVISVLRSNSVIESEQILRKASDRINQQVQEQQAQQAQQQQELQQQTFEQQRQLAIEDREDKQAHDIELENLKGEWKIKAEEVRSFINQQDQDVNNNNIPDQLEIERIKLEKRKQEDKMNLENKKLDLKKEEIKIKLNQPNKNKK